MYKRWTLPENFFETQRWPKKKRATSFFLARPRKLKYLKPYKNKIFKSTTIRSSSGLCSSKISYFGLKTLESCKLKLYQVEAIRRIFNRWYKKDFKIRFNVFFVVALTRKPAQVRMGKGKGKLCWFVCNLKKGSVFFEITGANSFSVRWILKYLTERSPVTLAFVEKRRRLPVKQYQSY